MRFLYEVTCVVTFTVACVVAAYQWVWNRNIAKLHDATAPKSRFNAEHAQLSLGELNNAMLEGFDSVDRVAAILIILVVYSIWKQHVFAAADRQSQLSHSNCTLDTSGELPVAILTLPVAAVEHQQLRKKDFRLAATGEQQVTLTLTITLTLTPTLTLALTLRADTRAQHQDTCFVVDERARVVCGQRRRAVCESVGCSAAEDMASVAARRHEGNRPAGAGVDIRPPECHRP